MWNSGTLKYFNRLDFLSVLGWALNEICSMYSAWDILDGCILNTSTKGFCLQVCLFFKNRFSSSFLSISLSHTQAQKENHISPAYLGECVRSWTVGLFPHVETCVSVYNFNEMIKRDYHSGHEKKRNKTKHKE